MKWVEVIYLRTTRDIEQTMAIVDKLAKEAKEEHFCHNVALYRRPYLNSDLSIILFYETTAMEKHGSYLGLRIHSALKEFGLVNHNIWYEMEL